MVADQTIRDADANAQGSTTMADLMAGLPPLLLGTYTPKIDAKGRMALPAKFRSQLGQGLVMARGQERCVYLLPFDALAPVPNCGIRTRGSPTSPRRKRDIPILLTMCCRRWNSDG